MPDARRALGLFVLRDGILRYRKLAGGSFTLSRDRCPSYSRSCTSSPKARSVRRLQRSLCNSLHDRDVTFGGLITIGNLLFDCIVLHKCRLCIKRCRPLRRSGWPCTKPALSLVRPLHRGLARSRPVAALLPALHSSLTPRQQAYRTLARKLSTLLHHSPTRLTRDRQPTRHNSET